MLSWDNIKMGEIGPTGPVGIRGPTGPVGIRFYAPIGEIGATGPVGPINYRDVTPPRSRTDIEIEALNKKLEEQRQMIDELTEALNETREKLQACLDFCFTDRSKWKEGTQS